MWAVFIQHSVTNRTVFVRKRRLELGSFCSNHNYVSLHNMPY
jgi:hypothetical protein